ncbi:flavodoxin, partial [candidate division WOR-3 bacterium]|nr:flavodoxin [candidate division WOR-3 bacterium]
MKSIIVLHSYHHNNTRKVAEAIADVIGAIIKSPLEIDEKELHEYNLIGFGSGIDSGMHYKELLGFTEKLTNVEKKKCFIFSTSAMQGKDKVAKDHSKIRKILKSKGYEVVGEFSCKGFNTNSFLKYIGGINKKRPNDKDILNAENF